jgi:hypothetical protein
LAQQIDELAPHGLPRGGTIRRLRKRSRQSIVESHPVPPARKYLE